MARSAAPLVIALFVTTHTALGDPLNDPLKPAWSRPLGKLVRLIGVEEYGRCIAFADKNAIQIVSPANDVLWTWPYRHVNRLLNLRDVAVSHDCDAVAVVGDSTYKFAWIAERGGRLITIPLAATPTEVRFDHTSQLVAVGTFSGSVLLYSRDGQPRWTRDTHARIVEGVRFSDDNRYITFKGWAGQGRVSLAGHVEWSEAGAATPAAENALRSRSPIARSDDGARMWLAGADGLTCVDERGRVLAAIAAAEVRDVKVSRDFAQVLVVSEKNLNPVSVERYEVPSPCKP
jgi:hypothetical protein